MVAELRFRFRRVLVLAMAFRVAAGATTDMRPLGRPQVYNNDRREWPGLEFVLKSCVGAPPASMRTRTSAEKSQLPMMLPDFGQDSYQEANALLLVLSPVLSGSSLQLLLNESGNGRRREEALCTRKPGHKHRESRSACLPLERNFPGRHARV